MSDDLDKYLTDSCPICGTAQICKIGQSREDATKEFFACHTKEQCDIDIKLNEEFKDIEKKPCPYGCGSFGGGYLCECGFGKYKVETEIGTLEVAEVDYHRLKGD